MNTLKEKLSESKKPIGTMVESASEMAVEGIGHSGLDFVVIDNEHSPIEVETSARLIRAAELAGMCPVVRVREISRPAILKVLDVGAQGLVIPNVSSAEAVKRIIEFSRFAPLGKRGFCPSRKDGWGFGGFLSIDEELEHFNNEVLIMPQCETKGALGAIETIARIEGVDGIFVGPYDLSIDMGIPGDFARREFNEAIERILNACHSNGKFCMCYAGTFSAVVDGFERGYDGMIFNNDMGVLIEAYTNAVKTMRAAF